MIPTHRPPTTPGEMLREEFLKPRNTTQSELAKALGVPLQTINLIVNGKRGITAKTARLLGEHFDMSPEFWMNLQARVHLWNEQRLHRTP